MTRCIILIQNEKTDTSEYWYSNGRIDTGWNNCPIAGLVKHYEVRNIDDFIKGLFNNKWEKKPNDISPEYFLSMDLAVHIIYDKNGVIDKMTEIYT